MMEQTMPSAAMIMGIAIAWKPMPLSLNAATPKAEQEITEPT